MDKENKYIISIVSPPDRNKLVAEIFFENVQWAEINQEKDFLEVEFYRRPDAEAWRIDYSNAINALKDAKWKLVGNNE